MERVSQGSLVYYQFEALGTNITHGIFTRLGGVSEAPWHALNLGATVGDDPAAVAENHQRIYAALGVDGAQVCTVWQVHGADTVIASKPVAGRRWLAKADGMVTDQKGLSLLMRYADCTPILLYDPVKSVIGMAHAGWRGTVSGAGVSVLRTMQAVYNVDPSTVIAGIGPSIGPDRYQVGEEVVTAVADYFTTTDTLIQRDPADGSAYLDLWQANALDLRRNGVQNIEIAGICTASNTHEFFSHRAEAGKTGRFVAVMAL